MKLTYAVIEITNRCNLRCRHCASTSGKARPNELSFDEIAALLESIRSLGGEEITIIGGEALLREDWYEICLLVTQLEMRLILISNGLQMTSETLSKLRALSPYLVGFSLDGATRESYRQMRGVDGFDHVMTLLEQLVDDGHPNVNAITTFTRDNLYQFDEFADLFDRKNITWQVQLANGGGKRFNTNQFITKADFTFFVERMKAAYRNRPNLRLRHMDDFGYCPIDPTLNFLHQTWHGCIAGRELIGVRSDGDVMGCLSLGDGFSEENIRRVPLQEIWTSDKYFTRFRNKQNLLTGACKQCPAADDCRAGCTSIAYSATGDIGYNPYCIRALENEEIISAVFREAGAKTQK
ncbi:MAG: radical SAM protein [Deltaproteobacteria bacterium]|nr:radical SAM protein [Deltaproteobacteria bacterium]MBN2670131.1 radical SAM protein [Deltaproteobacteria bacterium]